MFAIWGAIFSNGAAPQTTLGRLLHLSKRHQPSLHSRGCQLVPHSPESGEEVVWIIFPSTRLACPAYHDGLR